MVRILIVGAGFGGVSAALEFAHRHLRGVQVTIVSPTPHFEYHASLYRVLTGRSPLEVCIPLRDIFDNTRVEVIEDFITDVDFENKIAHGSSPPAGGSRYSYDYLVLALGSEPAYYDIHGLAEFSFSMGSMKEALRLKRHIHEVFPDDAYFIIVGGGPTGVETAGELAVYTKKLAKKHKVDESLVMIDLITSSSRLVPQLPKEISDAVLTRLYGLGVNIYLNRRVMKEEVEEVYLKDMKIRSKTVIWAAGVAASHLYKTFGLATDECGRVLVDESLRPLMFLHNRRVFVIGDGAATDYSGMAQTAIHDGNYVADTIVRSIHRRSRRVQEAQAPTYAVPVGPRWAATTAFGFVWYGRLGWWLRRLADLRFFLSILPFAKAITAWREDGVLWETCPVCKS